MTALLDLLNTFRTQAKTEREKGIYFEKLVQIYLRNEPRYQDLYKYNYKGLTQFIEQEGKHYAVPDRLMPAPVDDIDSMEWWEEGWAVGDNPRDRLCKRFGSKGLKKFHDFEEAVRYCFARQQKNKKQQFVLVYESKNAMGQIHRAVVRSVADIAEIDAKTEAEHHEIEQERARLARERETRYPELELLKKSFGPFKAWHYGELLAEMREKGRDHVSATMPKSSWYRLKKQLREAGIELPD